jgi:hypothetical protein
LPTYYKSRIYIDLSESDRYAEGFEKLVRWVFGKPLYVRPEIGKPPAYVADAEIPMLGTSALAKRVIDGLKNDKAYSRGALDEYLTLFSENLERFRITSTEGEPDDRIVKSIEEFTPSRNEFISVVVALIQYGEFGVFGPRLHRFYESLIPYLSRPSHVSTWNETDFDNFKFVVHELFLYTLSLHLRAEDFRTTGYLLAQAYYVPGNSDYGKNATVCFTVFRDHLNSLGLTFWSSAPKSLVFYFAIYCKQTSCVSCAPNYRTRTRMTVGTRKACCMPLATTVHLKYLLGLPLRSTLRKYFPSSVLPTL